MVMTSSDHPIQEPKRGHGQNPVVSLSQTPNLSLDRMRRGNEVPSKEITQEVQPWPGTIAKLGGLEPETVLGLLDLARETLEPPAMEDFMKKSPKDHADRIAETRPDGRKRVVSVPIILMMIVNPDTIYSCNL